MGLTAFEWALICAAAALAIAVIGFFLRRTIVRVDKHEEDIRAIHKGYATSDEVDEHSQAINDIRQTYVQHEELRELKRELRGETARLTTAVEEIKANYLTKSDFINAQAKTDRQLERILDMLIEMKGGDGNAHG